MANGVYGTTIPSRVTSSDVDIFYAYHETRNSDSVEDAVFTKLPSSILSDVVYDGETGATDNILEGLYNLKLPLQYFNRKGFYTVYIKPKEIPAVIADVSTLTAFPNVRGIILDSTASGIDSSLKKAFAGWSTDQAGKNMIDTWEYVPTKNTTIYAVWRDGWKVTYNAGEGYFESYEGDSEIKLKTYSDFVLRIEARNA